jgi:uncharacterized membrane protein
MQEKNPYAAPAAPVNDVVHAAGIGELIEGGRRVPSGNSWLWITNGFGLFKAGPGVWILIVIILFAISWLLSVLPFGSLALNLISPVFVGGLMLGCDAQAQGEPLEVAHLFAGFRERTGQLVLVGVLYLVGVMAAMVIASLIFGASILMSGFAGAATMAPITVLLFVLVVLALLLPLGMAVWFAPALVVFHDAAPVDAMKQSFQASLRNVIPFLLYGIILLCLAVVASIPLFLGWLVLIPTAICSTYYSYRDIFINEL